MQSLTNYVEHYGIHQRRIDRKFVPVVRLGRLAGLYDFDKKIGPFRRLGQLARNYLVFPRAKEFHGVGIFVHVYKTAKLVENNLPHEVPYINHMHSRNTFTNLDV